MEGLDADSSEPLSYWFDRPTTMSIYQVMSLFAYGFRETSDQIKKKSRAVNLRNVICLVNIGYPWVEYLEPFLQADFDKEFWKLLKEKFE